MLSGLRNLYSRPVRRDFLFYIACAAASAFFVGAGVLYMLRYAGIEPFGAGLFALACVPIALLIMLGGRVEKFALPGWLKLAIPATILASVLIFYLIL